MHNPKTEELTSRPATYFANPMEIVTTDKLQASGKLEALREWELDIRQLEVATEENMPATDSTTLQDVHAAMRALGHDPDSDDVPGGKAG